jgi:hypothetical protein
MNKLFRFIKNIWSKLAKDSLLVIPKKHINNQKLKIVKMNRKNYFEKLEEILKDKNIMVVFAPMSIDSLYEFYYWILFKKDKKEIDRLLREKTFDKSYFTKMKLNNYNTFTLKRLDITKIKNFDDKLNEKLKIFKL